MKTHKLAGKGLTLVLAGVILASLVAISSSAGPLAQGPTTVQGVTDIAPVLHYQGRLLDPATGNPKPNGAYQMIFGIYNMKTGGGPLWLETKSVAVTNGLFSVLLGDTVALDPGIFNGQALWLGVTVGADPEAVPRQRIAHSPYALHSQHANQANELGGFPPGAFARAVHEHNGAEITSGTVAAPRIDPAIARDDEVMPIVISDDGPGSGLDADLLDGQDGSAFALTSHLHDDRYYTEGESDGRFVNASGDTMSGPLTVPRIIYTSPRAQYFVVGGEGFVPGSNVDYFNTYGNGGAYIVSGSGALVAPVHLPHGAVVTELRVFFYDNSSSDMTVSLDLQGMSGGYSTMARVSSSGAPGYMSETDTTITSATIDNLAYSYLVYAYCSAWDGGNLKIKGAVIRYLLGEAQ
jgi:hypothetical protein